MQIKIHKSYREVVAICDSDLIGKTFEEGKFRLEVRENFFKGEEKPRQEIVEIMCDLFKEDATFNIVGKESVECALKAKIISKEGIKKIDKIPYAMVLM